MHLHLCFLLFASSAFGAELFTPGEKLKHTRWRDECITDHRVTLEDVQKTYGHNFVEQSSTPDNMRSFVFCYLKKVGWINESGDPLGDVIRPRIEHVVGDRSKASKIMDECVVKRASSEETSHKMVLCLRRALNSYLRSE